MAWLVWTIKGIKQLLKLKQYPREVSNIDHTECTEFPYSSIGRWCTYQYTCMYLPHHWHYQPPNHHKGHSEIRKITMASECQKKQVRGNDWIRFNWIAKQRCGACTCTKGLFRGDIDSTMVQIGRRSLKIKFIYHYWWARETKLFTQFCTWIFSQWMLKKEIFVY